jgi:uncharacterized membrane protein HdeD (DUF308 family)
VDADDDVAIIYTEDEWVSERRKPGGSSRVLPVLVAVVSVLIAGLLLAEHMSSGLLIGLVIGALLAVRRNRRYFARR